MSQLNDYYGFQSTPFSRAIDSAQLFQCPSFLELQARLSFSLSEQLPALITGDVGVGKSTAMRAFTHPLDRQLFPVIYLSNPHLKPATLYRQILLGLQVEPAFYFGTMLSQLRDTLNDAHRLGRCPILIVDEAHQLPSALFDQLRFLLNADMDSASRLLLILLGQPDLALKLRFAPFDALRQRIGVSFYLSPFDLENSIGYIKHHLLVAGCQRAIFSDGFLNAVHEQSKGVPRLINNLCRISLLLGMMQRKEVLDESDLKRALNDLQPPLP
ncbi:MAG: AAA family ATPase [Gammaproteobacteria bacterium]|nr:AAA family ATPase [Gammaproteobacteria bacterium]